MEEEEWRTIPSQPLLLASSWGRVMKLPHERPMPNGGIVRFEPKPRIGSITGPRKETPYKYLATRFRGGIGHVKIHRLVCEAFHGPAPVDKPNALHKDENSFNNSEDNLYWGTQKDNMSAPGFRKLRSAQAKNYNRKGNRWTFKDQTDLTK